MAGRNTQAVCNDGSAAGYYWAQATEQAHQGLYLIMLEGGEWCYDEASCALRQQNQASLMSSKGWKQTLSLGGLFETDATKTPFAGVNKVWGPYCIGKARRGPAFSRLWTSPVDRPRPRLWTAAWTFVDRHVARFECDSESNPALPSRFLRRRAAPNRRGVAAAAH